ncbi:MAG: hypothetical protein BroJett029_38740 [Alphaproteobacteria bacterium]|nr:MAG: hypothetical protein BroJett029_38740 [Alphaproteobacteria bacterium]
MRRYLTALSILLLTAPALAADGRVDVKAQARTVDGVGRILLEPEEPLAPEIRLDGSNLIVRFERPVKLNLADAVRPLAAFVAGVTRSADGRSFTLGLRQAVTLHTQPANGAVVIDLAPAAAPAAAEPQPAPIALAPLPAVRVRSGLHPGFVRVVFDWPQPVPFDVTESDGTLTLGFDRAAKLDISGVNPRHALFVRPPSADPAGGKTFATIVLPPGTGVRHFRAGNRIVVDLLKPAGTSGWRLRRRISRRRRRATGPRRAAASRARRPRPLPRPPRSASGRRRTGRRGGRSRPTRGVRPGRGRNGPSRRRPRAPMRPSCRAARSRRRRPGRPRRRPPGRRRRRRRRRRGRRSKARPSPD